MIETLQKSRYGPMIVRRHLNRPIEEWGALLADVPGATAILDRLLEGAEIVRMQGLSYRLRNAAMMAGGAKRRTSRKTRRRWRLETLGVPLADNIDVNSRVRCADLISSTENATRKYYLIVLILDNHSTAASEIGNKRFNNSTPRRSSRLEVDDSIEAQWLRSLIAFPT
jgi:hypothetical protein